MATFTGTAANNTLIGSSSADLISGLGGNDWLSGEGGNDILDGGTGADTLNGGSGTDTVSYANSSAGVSVSLNTLSGSGGDAQGDVLNSIEKIIGSDFNDTLSASASGVTLQGGTCADT